MKIYIEKKDLISALAITRKALNTHNSNPILDGILLNATDKYLEFTTSDNIIQINTKANADIQENGSIVLPGTFFSDIASKLPDDIVEISNSSGQNTVEIQCGKFKMSLQGIDPQEYPEMPKILESKTLIIQEPVLKDMINKTIFATAIDQARPILTGILFELNKQILSLVALSSNRMAIRKETVDSQDHTDVVIPASSLQKISNILSDDPEKKIKIYFGPSNALFEMQNTSVYTAFIAGEFLKYKNIIPNTQHTQLTVNRKNINDSIVRASMITKENEKKFVRIQLDSEKMIINANSEMGFLREEIDINATGPALEIAFNTKFLIDVLSKLNDEYVRICFETSEIAGVIKPIQGDRFFYLIAPVQI